MQVARRRPHAEQWGAGRRQFYEYDMDEILSFRLSPGEGERVPEQGCRMSVIQLRQRLAPA